MHYRSAIRAVAVALPVALLMTVGGAKAHDDTKYPNVKGQWTRFVVPGLPGQPSQDQTKPWGKGQQAPLTPEYQAILEASLVDQANGGHGNAVDYARCVSGGMPSMMIAFQPLEFIVLPETTYIIIADYDPLRRIFTDGRDWPKGHQPTFAGYSIGKWIDEDGDGKYDVLEVETRNFKGPRTYDQSGLPLHKDNQSIVKERIFLDKTDRNLHLAISSSILAGDFWARSRNLQYLRHIHRLDGDTSGVLLMARSPGALDSLSALFESRQDCIGVCHP
jgi:hypothetical protein